MWLVERPSLKPLKCSIGLPLWQETLDSTMRYSKREPYAQFFTR
jgi:hypothetical protein